MWINIPDPREYGGRFEQMNYGAPRSPVIDDPLFVTKAIDRYFDSKEAKKKREEEKKKEADKKKAPKPFDFQPLLFWTIPVQIFFLIEGLKSLQQLLDSMFK